MSETQFKYLLAIDIAADPDWAREIWDLIKERGTAGLANSPFEIPRRWGQDLASALNQLPGIKAVLDNPVGPVYEVWPDEKPVRFHPPGPVDVVIYIGTEITPERIMMGTTTLLTGRALCVRFPAQETEGKIAHQ